MKRNLFDIILDVILLLLSILIIYWAIQLILGGSPDLNQFNSAFIIAIIGLFFKVHREIGEIKAGMRYSFSHIKEDINSLKSDMALIKKKLKV